MLLDIDKASIIRLDEKEKYVSIKEIYKHTDTDIVTVVEVDGMDFWCDDEGLLKGGNFVNQYKYKDDTFQLAGKILILGHDDDGNSLGLTNEQFEKLRDNLKFVHYGMVRQKYLLTMNVAYGKMYP